MSDRPIEATRPIDENDRQAARRALARNWPDLDPASVKYAKFLEALADFHRHFGTDSFELRYRLRPPRNRAEEWTRQHMHGEISAEELRDRFKADAERPIDLEMLTAYSDAYQDRVTHYSGVLQEAVRRPHEAGTSARRDHERAIDEHVSALDRKFSLWRENLETVADFLEELRVSAGNGLVKVGEFEAISAHWLAQLVFTRTVEAWRSCNEISERSHRDPRYLYAITAVELFRQKWLTSLPSPQLLCERIREEFLMARIALRERQKRNGDRRAESQLSRTSAETDWSIDNECRELILVGEMQSIAATAGHIFRPISNTDWGLDGEIEFKDSAGLASGQRVYVQLKSGDSHLTIRKSDGEEIFTVKSRRHLDYWTQQAYPVMLIIRTSRGLIRWMDVSAYLKTNGRTNPKIVFRGQPLNPQSLRQLGETLLRQSTDD